MNILVTGGAGYIGSHTVVELLQAGHDVCIVDNFSNSSPYILEGIEKITNKKPMLYKLDIRDKAGFEGVFAANKIDTVIHFAGLKAVGESVEMPLKYYNNNLVSTLYLLETMMKYRVNNLVFSSSATVYGDPKKLPITEDETLNATNPYGRTKFFIEEILNDVVASNGKMSIVALRYFNPIGAHPSGYIGENPSGIPNNLFPYIAQVVSGQREVLNVFGNDYDTPDGTCVRDYIHVVDLAQAHIKALDFSHANRGYYAFNIGTGKGVSVLEAISAFEQACGVKVNYKIVNRRTGDIAQCYADPSLAKEKLGWKAMLTIEGACRDTWRYVKSGNAGA